MIQLTLRKALNKAFLKVKPNQAEMLAFRTHLNDLFDKVDTYEQEEHNKNWLRDFLNKIFGEAYAINTKGNHDLVIHNGNSTKAEVAVIIEVKKPDTKGEMVAKDKINAKALQQLLYYFLEERIIAKNNGLKYLIITDVFQWFIFDAQAFEKYFANDKKLVEQFKDFKAKGLSFTSTAAFYTEIAQPAIEKAHDNIHFTHFDLREWQTQIQTNEAEPLKTLIPLYKTLSPEHLLKLRFANDSNSLDKKFYEELLHLIGLHEVGTSKKTIERLPKGKRHEAALLENTIHKIDAKINRVPNLKQYGATLEEQTEAVALELVITWVNRILFLKLLEAQLITYHKGNRDFAFLNYQKIEEYDELEVLFFEVLAKQMDERSDTNKRLFPNVPYLNSSLFEATELEHDTFFVSSLRDKLTMPLLATTVLKDENGKRLTGNRNTLDYLFTFLDAYDFASEGTEDIQQQAKTIINASVLGLIFEKINGYKDGSFFTPGFITMYMCRETLRRAVIQKFNEVKSWNCHTFDELYDKITDRNEANHIVNSLKICDPAVGSGHFLVSALNEMIALKYDLDILQDTNGKRIKHYRFEVENDELVVWDEEEDTLFKYNPKSTESQRIQKMLFHEKQTIIENCLFGVDINPNSVKICRLRLWIELLKNAYYKNQNELETLPNIDINIKCGNSLISRFGLDTDLKEVLKKNKSKWSIAAYRNAVATYRNANNKTEKRQMMDFINTVKADFQTDIYLNDPKNKELKKLLGDRMLIENKAAIGNLFEKLSEKDIETDLLLVNKKIEQLQSEIEAVTNNRIFENAFEWRFEFPEVLNDEGEFIGFDVVIGNPPYGVKFNNDEKNYYKNTFNEIHTRTPESFNYFIFNTSKLLSKNKGEFSFIIPSSFLTQHEFYKNRCYILDYFKVVDVVNLGDAVFPDVTTATCILTITNYNTETAYTDLRYIDRTILQKSLNENTFKQYDVKVALDNDKTFLYKANQDLINKCFLNKTFDDLTEEIATGISPGLGVAFVHSKENVEKYCLEIDLMRKLLRGGEINHYYIHSKNEEYIIYTKADTVLNNYPNILNFLILFKAKLEKRAETKTGRIPWFVLSRPRREKLFENPKILIRQTANRIIAAYDDEKYYSLKSSIIIQLPSNSNISYPYLLGILNSKLMNFIYQDLVNEGNRIFPEVKPVQLKKLPIKDTVTEVDRVLKTKIETLVTEILAQKAADPKADTSELEKEIDTLVYELYGLTAEEIMIIENE